VSHNRSPFYLRFERVKDPVPMQPRQSAPVRIAEETAKHRNQGKPTNPIESCQLSDAGSTERQILRQIRDALKK
jgi:hypothetical protein